MDFIKNNWIILLIFITLAYLVYKYYKKTKPKSNIDLSDKSILISNLGNSIKSNTGQVNTLQTAVTDSPVTINSPSYKIGDKIFAGSTGVNTYSVPNVGVNYLVKHYNSNYYIGDFLSNENGYIKLIVSEKNTNVLNQAFGINYNDNTVRYVVAKQVYSK